MTEGGGIDAFDRGGGMGASNEDIGVSSLSTDCWLSVAAEVVAVSWLLSSKMEMDFLALWAGFQPSKSGRSRNASSSESSDSRYASLFAFLGLLRGFDIEKNLLFLGEASFSSVSISSHKRAFLGGLFERSVEGTAGKLEAVVLDDVRLERPGLLDMRANMLEIGSVRRRWSRGDVGVRMGLIRLVTPVDAGRSASSKYGRGNGNTRGTSPPPVICVTL